MLQQMNGIALQDPGPVAAYVTEETQHDGNRKGVSGR